MKRRSLMVQAVERVMLAERLLVMDFECRGEARGVFGAFTCFAAHHRSFMPLSNVFSRIHYNPFQSVFFTVPSVLTIFKFLAKL